MLNINPSAPEVRIAEHGTPPLRDEHGTWGLFIQANRHALDHIQTSEREARNEGLRKLESETLSEALSSFLTCLADSPESRDVPLQKDVRTVRKIVAAIMEAQEDETLTEKEAAELLRFIVAKFVERRIDRALRHMLPLSESKQWFYTNRKILR